MWKLLYVLAVALGLFLLQAAHAAAPYKRDAKLQRCMVYLPAMQDAKLRRWCMKRQERMP